MSDGKPTKPAKEKPNAYNKALGLLVRRREQSARGTENQARSQRIQPR
ncbi:MAG: hypothetical protein IPH43_06555 [Xanthomonadales bacterium]|nr:hypothetical protein [Xanthomonadales bacterium]